MYKSEIYGRELVDLRNESRWEFLNTLFSVSEAVMYMQVSIASYVFYFQPPPVYYSSNLLYLVRKFKSSTSKLKL